MKFVRSLDIGVGARRLAISAAFALAVFGSGDTAVAEGATETLRSDPIGQPSTSVFPLDAVEQRRVCADIPLNGHRMVNLDGRSTTGVSSKYEITHTGEKSYRFDFNIEFLQSPAFDAAAEVTAAKGGASAAQIDAYYRERVKNCLRDEVNPHLVSSDGVRIELRINDVSGENTYTRAASTQIHLQDANFRDNSLNYSSDVSCTTIAHELMHVAGLVDEYRETNVADDATTTPPSPPPEMDPSVTNPHLLYDCRAIGPSSSLMNDPRSLKPLGRVQLIFCKCPGGTCPIQPPPDLTGQRKCPAGYVTGVPLPTVMSKAVEIRDRRMSEGAPSLIIEEPQGAPLRPGHVRALLFPECAEKNQLYYRCAQNFQVTSNASDRSCPVLPPECSDPERWLQ